MILHWHEAFWIFIIISIFLYILLRIVVLKYLKKRFKHTMEHRSELLFSIPTVVKVSFLIIPIYFNYFLWNISKSIILVNGKNKFLEQVFLFQPSVVLKNGKIIHLKDCKKIIINNTSDVLVYEVVEYGSKSAIQVQNMNPSYNFNNRMFKAEIYPNAQYDCSKIGVHYFFYNTPPMERGSESALPFGNRDEEISNLYGWLRYKNVSYKRK